MKRQRKTRKLRKTHKLIHLHKKTKHSKSTKSPKHFRTALDAAERTFSRTQSIDKARESLRRQAFVNAHRYFGVVI